MMPILSPDKSESFFERADFLLVKKRPAEALLPYKRQLEKLVTNSWISSSN
jgi:hypothetical protein